MPPGAARQSIATSWLPFRNAQCVAARCASYCIVSTPVGVPSVMFPVRLLSRSDRMLLSAVCRLIAFPITVEPAVAVQELASPPVADTKVRLRRAWARAAGRAIAAAMAESDRMRFIAVPRRTDRTDEPDHAVMRRH